LLRVQCGKAKRGAGGGILLPVFILWEPFRYPFTWLPILALRPSTKAPPATTISNPLSISLLFSRIYLFGNPFVFFFLLFFFSGSGLPSCNLRQTKKKKKTKDEHTKKKRDWRTRRESLVFVSPLLAGFVDCACVCTSCYIVR
jgi:hypothetical protein